MDLLVKSLVCYDVLMLIGFDRLSLTALRLLPNSIEISTVRLSLVYPELVEGKPGFPIIHP
jgi:hypothetical protein